MMNAARSMCGWMDPVEPGLVADRANPSVGGPAVEPAAVTADQDRSCATLRDREIEGACGARHERDAGGFVALADELQGAMATLEPEILDVGATGLADSESVQPKQNGERGVHR